MLSKEDVALARKQLMEQVEKMEPGQRKDQAKQQVEQMSDEAVSAMVVEQQRQMQENAGSVQPPKSIFRMIIEGAVESKKVDENKEAIAVVSVRPVSKGHVIVIPKKPAEDSRALPSSAMTLAKKIAKKMVSKLKAERTEIQTSNAFNETIVNVIPIYEKDVGVNSPTYEASQEELQEIYDLLKVVKKPKKEVIRKPKKKEKEVPVLKLKRRIP